jgi:hypothetical protein
MAAVEPGGGDPACWLDDVCPDCGRFVEDSADHVCDRVPPPAIVSPPAS